MFCFVLKTLLSVCNCGLLSFFSLSSPPKLPVVVSGVVTKVGTHVHWLHNSKDLVQHFWWFISRPVHSKCETNCFLKVYSHQRHIPESSSGSPLYYWWYGWVKKAPSGLPRREDSQTAPWEKHSDRAQIKQAVVIHFKSKWIGKHSCMF